MVLGAVLAAAAAMLYVQQITLFDHNQMIHLWISKVDENTVKNELWSLNTQKDIDSI